jgi:uncharacterized protein involved in exopolysaccharide biosynthesis
MDEQPSTSQNNVEEEEFDFNITEWIRFLWSNKLFISKVMGGFFIAGVAVALLLPKQYTAIATILPPQVSDSKITGLLSNLGGIAGDLSGAGETLSKVYPDIAKSRNVLNGLLETVYNKKSFRNILQEKYRFKKDVNDRLIMALQKNVIDASTAMKTNVVTIEVTYTDPVISAALANEILNQMEIFFKYHYRSVATSQRMEIENRLSEVADSLKTVEERLLLFRERNRTTALSPTLQMQEARLAREVEINNALYIELTRQLEISKISEMQLRPVLNILDKAVPPIKKSKPSRRKIVLASVLFGFVLAVGYLKSYPALASFLTK